jgi:hypothetical protein
MKPGWLFKLKCNWKAWHLEWDSFEDHSAYWLAVGPFRLNFIWAARFLPCDELTWPKAREAIADWISSHGVKGAARLG